ncbi:NAD-dependent epimerase/dehydratase family protein [bacterium]|nr:NAD-dependent epimerase/dehydratase family protein [bacterium]
MAASESPKDGECDLVTGACGFTGAHLTRILLAQGRRVIAADLPRAIEHPKTRFVAHRIGLDREHPNLVAAPSDLTKPETLAPIFEKNVARVFHTASLYDYSAGLEILRRINIDGTRNLLDAMRGKPVRHFVHWSTCGVFGKPYTAAQGWANVPFTEESPSPKTTPIGATRPAGTPIVNDYSQTKFEQEQMVWAEHRERGLPLTVVRPAPVYGPGSDYGHGGIVIAIARGFLPVIPVDARHYITTSVHVEDVAGFAAWIADRGEAIGEDYNVVDDSVISYDEFLRYIALLVGRKPLALPFVPMPVLRPLMVAAARMLRALEERFRLPRPRVFEVGSATYVASSYWIANDKSKAAGYTYKYPDVKAGLRDTIRWFRDAGWLERDYRPAGIWRENL